MAATKSSGRSEHTSIHERTLPNIASTQLPSLDKATTKCVLLLSYSGPSVAYRIRRDLSVTKGSGENSLSRATQYAKRSDRSALRIHFRDMSSLLLTFALGHFIILLKKNLEVCGLLNQEIRWKTPKNKRLTGKQRFLQKLSLACQKQVNETPKFGSAIAVSPAV